MGWSALWGLISEKMASRLHSDLSNMKDFIDNAIVEVESGSLKGSERVSFLEILDSLANTLIETIIQRIKQKFLCSQSELSSCKNSEGSARDWIPNSQYIKAIQHFIEFSTLLSHAYAEVPKLLLSNASSNLGGVNKVPRRSENIWSHWRDHYTKTSREESSGQVLKDSTFNSSFDSQNHPGRLGLVCPLVLRRKNDVR